MVSQEYIPQQGDVIRITLNPQAGHEQAGRRPAVVLSPETYNRKTGLAIMCPITSQVKRYPFEVPIPEGLMVTGVILSDQVKNLDWRVRKSEFVCQLPSATMDEIRLKLGLLLSTD